ncbi:MAG TPA: hypothetical protein VH234_03755 [Candidatus Saccharimonadales bacterium]|jgi:hypothetical protein|nr:hypothetical protein [Candidatus Saccharimonadales bacterium]
MLEATAENHWSLDFEDHIAEVLAQQEEAQAEVDLHLRDGNLFGASMGSFKLALASLELGDRVDFHSHIVMAMVLAEADVVVESEAALPDPLAVDIACDTGFKAMEFRPPSFVSEISEHERIIIEKDQIEGIAESRVKTMLEERKLSDALLVATTNAELILNEPTVFDVGERNSALSQAITATSNLIFAETTGRYRYHQSVKLILLKFAKELASEIEIGQDEASDVVAFEAYETLMQAGLYVEGKTLGTLNQTINAFRELRDGPAAEQLAQACEKNISIVSEARQFMIARALIILPLVLTWQNGFKNCGDYRGARAKLRASKSMQYEAMTAYAEKRENSQLTTVD